MPFSPQRGNAFGRSLSNITICVGRDASSDSEGTLSLCCHRTDGRSEEPKADVPNVDLLTARQPQSGAPSCGAPPLRLRTLAVFRSSRLQPFLDQARIPAIGPAPLHAR